jgi:hypothetical protein
MNFQTPNVGVVSCHFVAALKPFRLERSWSLILCETTEQDDEVKNRRYTDGTED